MNPAINVAMISLQSLMLLGEKYCSSSYTISPKIITIKNSLPCLYFGLTTAKSKKTIAIVPVKFPIVSAIQKSKKSWIFYKTKKSTVSTW